MEKEVETSGVASGVVFVKYTDGTYEFDCKQCGMHVIQKGPKDTNQFDGICAACWKKGQGSSHPIKKDDYQQGARIGQAINLAQAHVLHFGIPENITLSDEDYIAKEMKLLARFYLDLADEIQTELSNQS